MKDLEIGQDFSIATSDLLTSVAQSAPYIDVDQKIDSRQILRYLVGRATNSEVEMVEAAAVESAEIRRQFVEILAELDRYQATPYGDLDVLAFESGSHRLLLDEWLGIVAKHVQTVAANLVGPIPATWPALARMAKQGEEEFLSAKAIWRALFVSPNLQSGRAPIRLGFGYRRGNRGTAEATHVFAEVSGNVCDDGAIEIEAIAELEPDDRLVFFAYSVNGRTLPLAEAAVRKGRAVVRVEGLGDFLRLPSGPIPEYSLSAKFDYWPESSKCGQIIVQAGNAPAPRLEVPILKNGKLILSGYFDDPELEGRWELLLAVTPNSWQMLAQFDITCVIERPQAISAKMLTSAKEGPFGGALLLRRSANDEK